MENSILRREVDFCRNEMKRQSCEIRNLTHALEEVMKFIRYPSSNDSMSIERDSGKLSLIF